MDPISPVFQLCLHIRVVYPHCVSLQNIMTAGDNVTHTDGEEEGEQSRVLFVSCLIMITSMLCHRLVRKWEIAWLSESFVTIVVGLLVGVVIHYGKIVEANSITFDEKTFTNYILPPIIFEAGFSMRHRGVVENLGTIFVLAVFGTILTAVLIGLLTYKIAEQYYPALHERPLWEAMCFGAILSAIDPVAVISVLGKMFSSKPPRIFYVIFGESVLNDAVAIVLYKVFLKFLEEGKSLDAHSVASASLMFVKITLVSLALGWVMGASSALILKNIVLRDHVEVELTILTLIGFGSYYIAEAMGMSGIMALFICGRTTCHYAWHNVSTAAQITAPQLYHFLAVLAETYVFSFLGLAFWGFDHEWSVGFTSLVLLTLFFTRMLMVFPCVTLCNAMSARRKRISLRGQIFMTLTGLRGAIAFGLALSSRSSDSIRTGGQFVSTTLVIIVLPVMTFGNLAGVLFRALGLDKDAEKEEREEEMRQADGAPVQAPSRFLQIERKYVAPLLRVTDHHEHHAKRQLELGDVLEQLQKKYAVRQQADGGDLAPPIGPSPPAQEMEEVPATDSPVAVI